MFKKTFKMSPRKFTDKLSYEYRKKTGNKKIHVYNHAYHHRVYILKIMKQSRITMIQALEMQKL